MKKLINWYRRIQIAVYHAAYHRNLKRAQTARVKQDIIAFKRYIYRAEDAWRKVVVLTEKTK
jgi:hypothetical protein